MALYRQPQQMIASAVIGKSSLHADFGKGYINLWVILVAEPLSRPVVAAQRTSYLRVEPH